MKLRDLFLAGFAVGGISQLYLLVTGTYIRHSLSWNKVLVSSALAVLVLYIFLRRCRVVEKTEVFFTSLFAGLAYVSVGWIGLILFPPGFIPGIEDMVADPIIYYLYVFKLGILTFIGIWIIGAVLTGIWGLETAEKSQSSEK